MGKDILCGVYLCVCTNTDIWESKLYLFWDNSTHNTQIWKIQMAI